MYPNIDILAELLKGRRVLAFNFPYEYAVSKQILGIDLIETSEKIVDLYHWSKIINTPSDLKSLAVSLLGISSWSAGVNDLNDAFTLLSRSFKSGTRWAELLKSTTIVKELLENLSAIESPSAKVTGMIRALKVLDKYSIADIRDSVADKPVLNSYYEFMPLDVVAKYCAMDAYILFSLLERMYYGSINS
jgi:hypothetical protein